jgi:hypothetical protein
VVWTLDSGIALLLFGRCKSWLHEHLELLELIRTSGLMDNWTLLNIGLVDMDLWGPAVGRGVAGLDSAITGGH